MKSIILFLTFISCCFFYFSAKNTSLNIKSTILLWIKGKPKISNIIGCILLILAFAISLDYVSFTTALLNILFFASVIICLLITLAPLLLVKNKHIIIAISILITTLILVN